MTYKNYTIVELGPESAPAKYAFYIPGKCKGYGKSEEACKVMIDDIEREGTYRTAQMKPR